MQVSTRAIVISKIRYGEHDLIVKCFTQEFGLRSYMIKGAFRSKKSKLKPAYFQLLSILHLEADHKDNRQLQYIKEVKVDQNLYTIHSNVVKGAVVLFLAEVLSSVLQEEVPNQELFNYLEHSILSFDQNEQDPNFHLIFLVQLTKYMGFYPDIDNIDAPYFDMLEGKFQHLKPEVYAISNENLTVLKSLLGIKFDRDKKLRLSVLQKQEFLNMILVYFKLHLSGFKEPKSLAVLNQVFR